MSAADGPAGTSPPARLSRRVFAAGSLGAAAAAVARRGPAAEAAVAEPLADYVAGRDPATRFEPVAEGELPDGRWRTGRLVSQAWRGVDWTHELSLFLPAGRPRGGRMLLWVDGGSDKKLPADGMREPSEAVRTIAAVGAAAGLPAAVVRQVPFQPMFDGLVEDDLIAHSFLEFVRTGDASWPLLLPMVKAAVEAMNARPGTSMSTASSWPARASGAGPPGSQPRWTTASRASCPS
jgi:PhoPQ-activated pathogenicity-related protein